MTKMTGGGQRGSSNLDSHEQPQAVAVDIEQLQLDAAGGCAVHPPVLYVDPPAVPGSYLNRHIPGCQCGTFNVTSLVLGDFPNIVLNSKLF